MEINSYQMNMTDDDVEILRQLINSNEANGVNMTPAVEFDDNPDDKVYLVLLSFYNTHDENNDYEQSWGIKIGRQSTYEFLKELVRNESIDPNMSFIIAAQREANDEYNGEDNVIFVDSKPITVFRFLKVMYETRKVLDNGIDFDIDEYNVDDMNGDITILDV